MNTYFQNITNLEELKKAFRKLMAKNHPDKGGDTATCQNISNEYEKLLKKIIAGEDDSLFTKNEKGYSFWDSREQMEEIEIKVKEALMKIIALEGLEIEVIGVWIWVSGETRTHKEALKEAGFRWIPNKEKWAFAGKKASSYGKMDMEAVREKYGTQKVDKNKYASKNRRISVA